MFGPVSDYVSRHKSVIALMMTLLAIGQTRVRTFFKSIFTILLTFSKFVKFLALQPPILIESIRRFCRLVDSGYLRNNFLNPL